MGNTALDRISEVFSRRFLKILSSLCPAPENGPALRRLALDQSSRGADQIEVFQSIQRTVAFGPTPSSMKSGPSPAQRHGESGTKAKRGEGSCSQTR